MPGYYIELGGGKRVSVGAHNAAVHQLKQWKAEGLGNVEVKHGFTGWWPVTVDEALHQWKRSVHCNINRNAGEAWRNEITEREREEQRDAQLAQLATASCQLQQVDITTIAETVWTLVVSG